MENVVVLDFWPSPFAMRVKVALNLKGVKYECKDEDLGNKSDLLLQMNPVYKKIPVLINGGKPICESLITVQYIDEMCPGKCPLLPADPYRRAQSRFWADYVDKQVYDFGKKLWSTAGDDLEAAKKGFVDCLKVLEIELGEKHYFGGETLGLVDVAMIPFYSWFHCFETHAKFSIESHCPKLIAWAKRCMKVEAVATALPDQKNVYAFSLDLKKKLGIP